MYLHRYRLNTYKNSGFTLVELIVALAIGLIVSAAALQLFTGGLITTRMQDASAELQDSGVFGLEYMARDIRLANYGNINNPILNDKTSLGGIVFTSGDPAKVQANLPLAGVDASLLTKTGGSSNVGTTSDQLTIQFIAPNAMVNCEGGKVASGQFVIQRYFLRTDNNGLALACKANTTGYPPTTAAGLVGNGEIIMPRVDQLRFYFGVKDGSNLRYYTLANYKTAAAASTDEKAFQIVSVKIYVLVRSRDTTESKDIDPSKESFSFPDGAVIPSDTKTKYMRRMYSTTIAMRNGLGVKI
ncbi:PilW family protein [Acinetobacter populi]|nr:PilW family protein [Acinetobacter populi]